MKYISKDNLYQYDELIKNYISDKASNLQEILAYGVQWSEEQADPHLTRIGNMTMHKTLPIQNNMKGVIAQKSKVMYYLDENDWRWRATPLTVDLTITDNTIVNDLFSTKQYEKQWLRIGTEEVQVISIDTTTRTATLDKTPTLTGKQSVELGAVLNGYDGTVRVKVPRFWIKAYKDGNIRQVWVSQTYIDASWAEQTSVLIDAYKSTVLNTIPENMGFLSTLQVGELISVQNIHDYCRGGNNRSNLDDKDQFMTDLGKARTQLSMNIYRPLQKNQHILSYYEYKNIFYWLFVIEYANFNCQEEFTDTLTSEGFRQGGLDKGLTTIDWNNRILFNDLYPITPNGYTNDIGNGTGQKNINSYKFTANTSVSRFKVYQYDNNVITANQADNLFTVTSVKKASTKAIFVSAALVNGTYIYKIEGLQTGQSLTFKCDTYSNQIQTDGEYSIEWDINTNQQRQIVFNFIGNCNIKISLVKAGTTSKEITFYFKINRWHGIENPFGDTWTLLDGVLCSPTVINNANKVYMCKNPKYFSSNLNVKYQLIGTTLHHNGWGKQWKFTSEADLLTDSVGANSATYRCDVYYIEAHNNYLRMLLVGNDASGNDMAGLGMLSFQQPYSSYWESTALRSVSVFSD